MSPSQYGKFVSEIAERITSKLEDSAPSVKYGLKCKVMGKSGYEHQIDVRLDWPSTLSLIECKKLKLTDKKRKVTAEQVLAFESRLRDIRKVEQRKVHRFIATTNGFQSGAVKLLKYFNIDRLFVTSPKEIAAWYKDNLDWVLLPPPAEAKTGVTDPFVDIT